MKKFYTSPELEISLLTAEDILDGSPNTGSDNEIFIDSKDFFGE